MGWKWSISKGKLLLRLSCQRHAKTWLVWWKIRRSGHFKVDALVVTPPLGFARCFVVLLEPFTEICDPSPREHAEDFSLMLIEFYLSVSMISSGWKERVLYRPGVF